MDRSQDSRQQAMRDSGPESDVRWTSTAPLDASSPSLELNITPQANPLPDSLRNLELAYGHLSPLRPKNPITTRAASSDDSGNTSRNPGPALYDRSSSGAQHQPLHANSLASSPLPPCYPRPPMLDTPASVARRPLCDLIHNTVWAVARAYGFQAFNACDPASSPGTSDSSPGPQWMAATAFLAADHLEALLLDVLSSRRDAADHEVVQLLLSELALYFLLYSEAANLRHTPELMWFLFWAAIHSPAMEHLWREGLHPEQALSNARQRRLTMRNALHAQLRAAQERLGHDPTACYPDRCGQVAVQLASQLPDLISVLGLPPRQYNDSSDIASTSTSASTASTSSDLSLPCPASRQLFVDLACYGDGGFWTDVLVSPLFTVLAFEVDLMASSGQEVAHRLGYDDVNESMCRRDVVGKLLATLGVSKEAAAAGQVHGVLDALTQLGYPPAVSSDTGNSAVTAAGGAVSRDPRRFDPVLAASVWSDSVFIKTHRERRSWAALLRAFYRVYSLQLVMMHATMAVAFAPGSLRALSSAVLTHAVVAALERTANWWLTRGTRDPLRAAMARESWTSAPVEQINQKRATDEEMGAADGKNKNASAAAAPSTLSRRSRLSDDGAVETRMELRRRTVVDGSPVWGGVFGWLEWVLVAVAMLGLFALQHMGPAPLQDMARSYWPLAAAGYTAVVVVHGLITTRDGYTLSLSSALRLPAIFRASSQRATPSSWLHRPMAVGWRAALLTALFWIQVLGVKVAFDYFVIMKPMAGQVRHILRRNWLACPGKQTHYRLFGMQLPIRCLDGDWLLVALRVAPFVLVCLVDTQIFYQLMLMVWGLVYGLVSINLGIAGSWEGLRSEFHRAPLRWWARCMSGTANNVALAAAAAMARRRRRQGLIGGSGFAACLDKEDEDKNVYDGGLPYLKGFESYSANNGRMIGSSVSDQESGPLLGGACLDSCPRTEQPTTQRTSPREPPPAAAPDNGDGASEASSFFTSASDQKGKSKSKGRHAAAAELVAMLAGQSEEQLAQWMAFAAAWDEVVEDLRSCDLISDREKSNLLFTRLPAAATSMLVATAATTAAGSNTDVASPPIPSSPGSVAGSDQSRSSGGNFITARPLRPFLLPAFFYSGQIQRVVDTGAASPSQQLVLAELRSLLVWLGCQLRLLDGPQAAALLTAACCPAVLDTAHSRSREKGLAALRSLVASMQAMTEPPPCLDTGKGRGNRGAADVEGWRRSLYSEAAAALDGVLAAVEVEARAVLKAHLGAAKGKKTAATSNSNGNSNVPPAQGHSSQGLDGATADPQSKAVALLEAVSALRMDLAGRPERLSAALALLHPENGGSAKSCPSSPTPTSTPTSTSSLSLVSVDLPLLVRVLSTASKMLNLSSAAAQPTGSEARRILGFFITSLANRQLSKPCPVACMTSWTVLTPLYAEDVLFPLEAGQVAEALGLESIRPSGSRSCHPASLLPDLLSETEEHVSLMAYIRSLYPKDWDNFKERLGAGLGGLDLSVATEADFMDGGPLAEHALSLQLWASYRGQLLARTVRGMAAYERALRVLAAVESPRPPGKSPREHAAEIEDCVASKFTHVVASQLYGHNRRSSNLRERWLAESTDLLLEAFPYLRVSYVDTVPVDKRLTAALVAGGALAPPPSHQYAVLIRGRRSLGEAASAGGSGWGRTEELYRVRLPYNRYSKRGIILGEGKPENQNHAAIFCFGEALQTIDMNQDNTLAEALKMRNLLGELAPDRDTRAAKRAMVALQAAVDGSNVGDGASGSLPAAADLRQLLSDLRSVERPVAVVGFREWVFSDKAGALGSFAASSEFAFSTMVQRTMAYPANVRLHYGHPDAFNKLFVMTRGGVAKATRQLHVSEDIFGGMNHSLRGGRIKFREYVSCGKGRDMGFDSINAFESKISSGFGEVALSRDLLRMATRVDLWRCLHLYHSLAGNYFNTWLVMGSVYAQVYAVLFFSLAGAAVHRYVTYYPSPPVPPPARAPMPPPAGRPGAATSAIAPPPPPLLVHDSYAYDTIRVEHMLQMGLLLLLPYLAEIALEHGLLRGLLAALGQVVSGSFTFFIFKQQTTTTALHRSMLYGGATYIATGRGFSITSSSFIKLFANYGRSHISLGFELGAMAVAVAATLDCSSCSYAGLTWGTWLAALSLVLAPCWFNPMAFSPAKVKRDMHAWAAWLRGEADRELGCTWHQWNRLQLSDSRDDGGTQTDRWLNVLQNVALRVVPPALLALAAASRLDLRLEKLPALLGPLRSAWLLFLVASALLWGTLAAAISTARRSSDVSDQRRWRLWVFWVGTLSSLAVAVFLFGLAHWYSGNGVANLFVILYANANLLLALHRAVEHLAPRSPSSRRLVDGGYWLMDCSLGWLLLGLLGALSLVGVVARVQTTMLFNVTFARSVRRGSLVKTIGMSKAERRQKEAVLGMMMGQEGPGSSSSSSMGAEGREGGDGIGQGTKAGRAQLQRA
ncbi:hypothetical protein VOLCADRAFT_87013 [Volvox carteri f. nagariensis]|uniref:Glycosyl transferase 48 domain-containing protein n=1 Tax=Volvox carteri f. nagariensis TaxID=3068 RepID=D8TJY3_VOLCA|nr:uncharacterized protein VOLCADRAFT_87013 [Volvox carteri f. nagariensis]EFJ51969.1 hypothetical protein VOLCADRAFT_87013 [Volvox carteri f. nagariensis]|eukprot:XP_002946743.1 hypothetical protein VOLCADRAFT_87013 [Volvox carteri f. nagariensis]